MSKRFKFLSLVLICGLSLIFAPASTVFAAPQKAKQEKPAIWLQVSPVSNRISLKPNDSLEYNFNVENIGAKAFKYKVYAAPYSVTNENYDLNFSSQTKRTQLSRWLSFKQPDGSFSKEFSGSINPGEKQTITYKVSTPKSIPEGGQYATIFAQSEPEVNSNTSGIRTVSRVGVVIFGRTLGNTKDISEIKDINLPGFLAGGNLSTQSLVKNNGNTDFGTRHSLTIEKVFGTKLYEKTNDFDVLPETSRKLNMVWDNTPRFGLFHVTSKVTALDKTKTVSKLVLIMPLPILIIVLILLTTFIVWTTILIKKRRNQKSKLIV